MGNQSNIIHQETKRIVQNLQGQPAYAAMSPIELYNYVYLSVQNQLDELSQKTLGTDFVIPSETDSVYTCQFQFQRQV